MDNTVPAELSKRVTALRIVLISLVIVRHNTVTLPNESLISFWVKELISNGLFYGNVALSFIFSGYFLTVKKHNYDSVLKRKFHSLVIPYVFWMTLYFVIYVIMFNTPRLHEYSQVIFKLDSWKDFDYNCFVKMFIGYGWFLNLPALAGQMWFLRDLIIFSIVYPVFQYLFDFRKKYCIAFTLLLIVTLGFIYGKSIMFRLGYYPILFFAVGIICGLYNINFFEIADRLHYFDLIVGIVIFVLLNKYRPNFLSCCVPVLRLLSSLFWLKISKILVEKEKVFAVLKKLSTYSFFIYAVHFSLLVRVIQKCGHLVPANIYNSCIFSLFWYVFASALTFAISVGLGMVVKKIAPKFFSIITGGR